MDLGRYFWVNGRPQPLPQRDAEYMNETGEAIARAYRRETVLMATHLLAHVTWRRVCKALPGLDLYRRLRQPLDLEIAEAEVLADLERLQTLLRSRGHLLGPYASGTPQQVLAAALAAFGSYHTVPAVERAPGASSLMPGDRQLLFYYQNRVESLGVEL